MSSDATNSPPMSPQSTPATSPPPESPDNGVSESMQKEEEQMRLNREKRERQHEKKLEKERQKDIDGGKDAVDSKFKALEYLLSQSKVRYFQTSSLNDASFLPMDVNIVPSFIRR